MRKFYTLLVLLALGLTSQSQTVLLSPTGDGGFETGDGSFAANGWTVVNGTATNKWFTGTLPTGFTNRSAYISQDAAGAAWTYNNGLVSVVHFYRDITIPAGQTQIQLKFDWKAAGETGFWDALLVGFAPTTFTPAASTTSIGQGLPDGITNAGSFWTNSAASPTQNAVINVPEGILGNCSAPVTVRLVFTWKNDGTGGVSPPGTVDNISLTSQAPAGATPGRIPFTGGTFSINPSLPNTGTNFTTFSEAVTDLNKLLNGCGLLSNNIIFNVAAGTTFTENVPSILMTGTSTASITFQKSGAGANPVVKPVTPGTIASSTTLGADGDAIINIIGSDYITFDGIDVATDPAFTGNGKYEYGYLLEKANAVDACKNITIKNCTITLDKPIYSFGIYVSNNLPNGTAVVLTSPLGRSENIKIFNNTIDNCYGGINVTGAVTGFDTGTEIGVGGGNTITNYGGGATISYGVYTIYQDGLKVANNRITSATGGHTTTLYGINVQTAINGNTDIYRNTITITGKGTTSIIYGIENQSGGTGTNNTINIYNNTITGITYTTSTTGSLYAIHNGASAFNVNIYGNYIYNNSVSPTTTGNLYGIFQEGAVVSNVKIYKDTVVNNTKTTGTTGVGRGIYNTGATTSTSDIYENIVSGLAITGTAGTAAGIYSNAGGTIKIHENKISDLTYTATTGGIHGITLAGGTTYNVYNNFISDLKAPATNNAAAEDGVRGINITSTTATATYLVAHNTIYLNAVSTGALFSTAGVYHTGSATATTAALDLRNNIIVNTSTPSGAGRTVALRRSATSLSNYATTSNNNLFYAGTPGANNVIYYDGTNADLTLGDFKTRVTTRESASISKMPAFVNIATAPYDLHINTAIATEIESGGTPVAAVTTDIDGNPRSATTPDIGADEFAGISADLTGPSIGYTALPVKTICTSVPAISATITDGSGVNSTAGTKPRLYFKKAGDNNVLAATNTSASNGWKWVEATNSSSPYTFTFDFNLLTSPLAAGDSVSYFIIAQDLAGTPNVGVNTATFSVAPTSVALSAAQFPASGTIKGFLVLTQPNPISIKVSKTELCSSGSVTLDIDAIDVPGGEFQWQSSPAGANTWSDISSATTIPYTTATFTASTDFRLVIKCSGTPIAASPSPVVTVTVNNPQVATSTGASRCGPGTLTLQATSPGLDLNWYTAATGGAAIFNGNAFTTPALNTTTTYYVGASTGGGSEPAGRPTYTANPNTIGNAWGLVFNVVSRPVTITSVDIFSVGAAGSISVQLTDAAGTVLQTAGPFSFPAGTATVPVKVTLPVNFTVPVGTGYRMLSAATGTGSLIRETSGITYPYTSPSNNVVVTSGYIAGTTLTTYYFFYNWQVSAGCEGTRVPVAATIVTPPAITKNANPASICIGQSSTLTAGSTNAGYTYSWQPVGQTGASVTVSPAANTRYYVTAVDISGGTFNGCTNLDSVDISVSPVPSPITITPPSPVAVCATGPAGALTVEGGTIAFTGDIGTGTVQNLNNSTTNLPPYGNYYTGNRHQMLILASELTAQGFTSGSMIGSLAFDVISNTNTLGYNGFTIKIGHTTAAALTTTFLTTATTQVFTTSSLAPPVAGWSTHDFTTPFVWNGTSNIVVETYFTNCGMGVSTCTVNTTCTGTGSGVSWLTSAVTNQSNTSFVSHAYYYSDGESCNPQTITTATTTVSVRPNMRFGFGAPTTITWSPVTGLYTDAAATTAYTAGANARTVYAKPAIATTYTAAATVAGGACSSTGSVSVTVTTPPSATIAYSGSPYCNTGTATVTHTGSVGGSYSSTGGLSVNATTGAINLVASTPGTYLVTYTVTAAGGCASYSTTASVTVNAAPSATISYPGSPFCIGAGMATVFLTGTTGGTYSSTAGLVINPTTGAVDITASTLGSYTVTYTVAASGGCPTYTTTTNFSITTSPAAAISYAAAPYCTNAGMAAVTLSGSTGGTYSSTTGLSINATTGEINLGASTPGTYTITYAIAAGSGCSAFSTTTSITINTAPSATIMYAGSPYCSGAGTATVTHTGTTGGTYSSTTGLMINATTGAIDLAASTPGTYIVTYTVAPANGCVVYTATASVIISVRPNAIISYTGSPFCNSGTTVNVTRVGTAGGTYSSSTGLSLNATTGTINIATSTVGTYTITYTIPAGNGCAVFTTTTTVGIVPPPAATISYAGSPYCSNAGTATVTFTGTVGGQFTSTNGLSINQNTGNINLGASVAGTYTVTYTVPGATGCSAFSTTASVTVTTAPAATINYAGNPFCSNGTTVNVTRTGNIGGTYSSATGLSINATTGTINIAASTPGSYLVSYTVTGSGGCANLVATTPVVITQSPGATISYAGSPYCSGAGTATVTHTGTTGGSYSSTNGLVINSTTGAVDLAASVPGTYVVNYIVAASNGCAVYSASTGVTINAMPSATIIYAGSPYCGNGSTANVTRTGTAGGTYSSTTGLSLSTTTGAITLGTSTPGTYTVTYTVAAAGACAGFSTTTSVTINTAPSATISYTGSPFCASAGTVSVTRTGTTGGTFSSTTGLSINASTGAITLGTSTAGTYTITYSIAGSGGCQLYTATTSVTVTAAPVATISYTGSPYCGSTGTAGVTLTGSPGGTYSSSAGLSINPQTGAVNIGASTPGSYTVSYTVPGANGCPASTGTTTLLLTTPGTWTGLMSSDWNNPSNWCGGMPSSATDAVIPSSAPNMPVISNGSASVRNISTGTSTSVTVAGGGTLELYGNFTGGGALNAASGNINMRGSSNQSVPAFTTTNLLMNQSGAGSSLVLGGNSVVTGSLTLASGNIILGANNISLASGSNGKLTSHIITNGTGSVIVTNLVASQNRTVPVGSDAVSYNPVALITNAGHTADNFTVRVVPGVFENGVSGTTLTTHVVDRMWIINEGIQGGSNMNVTLQWMGSQELPSFNRTKSYVTQYGTNWPVGTATIATGADPFSQIKTGVTTLGSFSVQTEPIPRPVTGIYPNPVQGFMYVVTDLLSTGPVVFSIYDDKGSLVYRKKEALPIGLNQTRLDIPHLAAGVYLLKVSTRLNDKFIVTRFLKTN